MKDIKCFVFDFGNVVAFFDHKKACRQLAKLADSSWTAERIYEVMFSKGGLEEQYDRGQIQTDDFLKQIKKQFSLDDDDANHKIRKAWCDIFWLNENMARFLIRLKEKSFKLILASNTNKLHHEWFEEKFKEDLRYFERPFVLSYDIRLRKPDPEFFAHCIERAQCHASQCIYVDDREDFVAAACKMGMNGIVVDDLVYRLQEFGIVDLPSSKQFGLSVRQATTLAIYKEKYANFRHFDTLRWQIPGLVFVVGGAIIIGSLKSQGIYPEPLVFLLYGLFVFLCAWLMRRIGYHMKRNTNVLKSIAARLGDHSIPVSPAMIGAANVMEKFIWALGIVALVVAAVSSWKSGEAASIWRYLRAF